MLNKEILLQPSDGLCGQACLALLMNKSIDEIVKETKCGKGKMSGRKLFEALELYKISHAEKMKYTRGKTVQLPSCCILSEHGHFLLHKDEVFYDNVKGVFSDYDFAGLVAYLELYI